VPLWTGRGWWVPAIVVGVAVMVSPFDMIFAAFGGKRAIFQAAIVLGFASAILVAAANWMEQNGDDGDFPSAPPSDTFLGRSVYEWSIVCALAASGFFLASIIPA